MTRLWGSLGKAKVKFDGTTHLKLFPEALLDLVCGLC